MMEYYESLVRDNKDNQPDPKLIIEAERWLKDQLASLSKEDADVEQPLQERNNLISDDVAQSSKQHENALIDRFLKKNFLNNDTYLTYSALSKQQKIDECNKELKFINEYCANFFLSDLKKMLTELNPDHINALMKKVHEEVREEVRPKTSSEVHEEVRPNDNSPETSSNKNNRINPLDQYSYEYSNDVKKINDTIANYFSSFELAKGTDSEQSFDLMSIDVFNTANTHTLLDNMTQFIHQWDAWRDTLILHPDLASYALEKTVKNLAKACSDIENKAYDAKNENDRMLEHYHEEMKKNNFAEIDDIIKIIKAIYGTTDVYNSKISKLEEIKTALNAGSPDGAEDDQVERIKQEAKEILQQIIGERPKVKKDELIRIIKYYSKLTEHLLFLGARFTTDCSKELRDIEAVLSNKDIASDKDVIKRAYKNLKYVLSRKSIFSQIPGWTSFFGANHQLKGITNPLIMACETLDITKAKLFIGQGHRVNEAAKSGLTPSGYYVEYKTPLSAVVDKLKDQVKYIGDESEVTRMRVSKGDISKLEDEISQLKDEISQLEGSKSIQVGKIKGEISAIDGKISAIEGEISQLEGKISELYNAAWTSLNQLHDSSNQHFVENADFEIIEEYRQQIELNNSKITSLDIDKKKQIEQIPETIATISKDEQRLNSNLKTKIKNFEEIRNYEEIINKIESCLRVMQLLLDKGADPSACNTNGDSAYKEFNQLTSKLDALFADNKTSSSLKETYEGIKKSMKKNNDQYLFYKAVAIMMLGGAVVAKVAFALTLSKLIAMGLSAKAAPAIVVGLVLLGICANIAKLRLEVGANSNQKNGSGDGHIAVISHPNSKNF